MSGVCMMRADGEGGRRSRRDREYGWGRRDDGGGRRDEDDEEGGGRRKGGDVKEESGED